LNREQQNIRKIFGVLIAIIPLIALDFFYGFPEYMLWFSLAGVLLSSIGLVIVDNRKSCPEDDRSYYMFLLIIFFVLLFITLLNTIMGIIAVAFTLVVAKSWEAECEEHVRASRT
jgi:dolichol kinase